MSGEGFTKRSFHSEITMKSRTSKVQRTRNVYPINAFLNRLPHNRRCTILVIALFRLLGQRKCFSMNSAVNKFSQPFTWNSVAVKKE